jgi:hypothetical protein
MRDKFDAIRKKLKTPVAQRIFAYSVGVGVGSIVTRYYIRRDPHLLHLSDEAFNALMNDETNFIRFANDQIDYAFHLTLEQ